MGSFVEAVAGILRERTCNLLSNPLIDGQQWGGRPPFVGEGVGSNPLTRRWYNNGINGLRSIFCDEPVEDNDYLPPPFTGGQCPIRYFVSWTGTVPNFSGGGGGQTQSGAFTCLSPNSIAVFGPITGTTTRITGNFWQHIVFCHDNNGNPVERIAAGGGIPSGQTASGGSITITGVSPCSGNDDCGDPPPIYQPINVFNFTDNITYIDNSNNTVNELGDFNLFAPIFLPGSIQIPFNLNVGEVNFSGSLFPNGTINISPEFNIGVGSQNDPSPIDEPDLDDDEEYEIEPSEDQESIIVGAWVVVTQDSARATQVAEGGVTHFYPRQGILKFRMAFGSSGFTYSPGVDVKTRRAYIPVPRTGRAIGADWFGYSGNSATVTLAYAEITPNLLPASD